MKIERPKVLNAPESTTQETATAPAQLEKPLPKTDSVEMKPASFYNFDNAAKLDPSQSPNAKEVPAALIPGIPFREKAELPKTLPNGTSVESGVASGDLGFGKTRPGPNHMGIDLKAGGTDIRNQLDDALKLREGAGSESSAPPSGTVDYTALGAPPRTQEKYEGGFDRPGMAAVSVDRNPFKTLAELPKIVEEVTGRAADFLDGLKAILNPQEQEKKKLVEKEGDGIQEYVNPDAPEGAPVITAESLEKVGVRLGSRTQPGVEEHLQEIDGSMVSGTDPRRELISNPNTEDQSSITGGSPQVILDVKGPEKDPEFAGGEPIVFDPKRPR